MAKDRPRVIGSELRVAPRFAAFANGVGIHADDFDDTQLAVASDRVYGLLTHPTAPALPAALAAGEMLGKDGKSVLLAYLIGVEVECKIAEAINPRHYQTGFHATATCGTFAAASAAARLMGLDARSPRARYRRRSVGGIAREFRHHDQAVPCRSFVGKRRRGAQFADLGWTAADTILEAPRGFFRAAGGGFDPNAIVGKLGRPWTFASPGISIKPHPSGSLTHPGMTEMLRLIKANAIKAEDVVHVRVGTNSNMPNALIHHRPQNELQAKFSMEFCMAILLLDGRATLAEFTDEIVMRPDVKAMIEKVDFVIDDEAERAGFEKMTTIIDIDLADGRRISGRADFGRGSPAMPMSYDEVAEKFLGCTEFAHFPEAKAREVISLVRSFETLPSIAPLMRLLAVEGVC